MSLAVCGMTLISTSPAKFSRSSTAATKEDRATATHIRKPKAAVPSRSKRYLTSIIEIIKITKTLRIHTTTARPIPRRETRAKGRRGDIQRLSKPDRSGNAKTSRRAMFRTHGKGNRTAREDIKRGTRLTKTEEARSRSHHSETCA